MHNTRSDPARSARADYPHFLPIQSRWNDMDKLITLFAWGSSTPIDHPWWT